MSGETDKVLWRGVRPIDGIRGIWPARDAVRINESNEADGVATTVIYTVPANKILFIGTAGLTSRLTVAAGSVGSIGLRDGSDVHQYYFARQRHQIVGSQTNNFQFSPALEVVAGWDVYVKSGNANLFVAAFIFGWLEDA